MKTAAIRHSTSRNLHINQYIRQKPFITRLIYSHTHAANEVIVHTDILGHDLIHIMYDINQCIATNEMLCSICFSLFITLSTFAEKSLMAFPYAPDAIPK